MLGGAIVKKRNEKTFNKKKNEIMEISYDCYAEHGLAGTGIKTVMDACGMSKASIYTYFDSIDDLILQSTAHFMIETELAYMRLAPKKIEDVDKFIDETPYWASKKYGKKYRLMYQIYTHPKYVDYGKKFFDGVNNRYIEYSETIEKNLGIPKDELLPLIFIFVNATIHYSVFEDDFYLKVQLQLVKMAMAQLSEKYLKK